MNRGECGGEEGEIEIDGEQNGKQVSETMTEKTDTQAGRLRLSPPIDTAWLMYLRVAACVCVCVYANASCEIILCGLRAHAEWEHSSAFTGTDPRGRRQIDRQMERQSIISSLVQRFSNMLIPKEQHIDPCFQVSPLLQILTQKHPPERIFLI